MMPISLKFIWLTGLVAFLAVGCVSIPSYTFYTLSAIEQTEDALPQADYRSDATIVSVGPVSFPAYLDRPQIVTRPTTHTLKIHEFQRWGGSLEADFVRVLSENMSTLLGDQSIFLPQKNLQLPVDYRVAIDVKRFDGNLGDQIVLEVDWMIVTLKNKGHHPVTRRTVLQETVDSRDYESLVAAKSLAVEKLSREITEAILRVQKN
jgi:uncharacterized lipoprotein YmbA